ncbi:MAG: hypothetical protein H5T74_12870 [Actinobacteria bacterium]|nr:hypothetical protein [Actinomycetota bacterium]
MAKVIGLSGPFGAGCSTVAGILKDEGYQVIKASAFITEWAERNDVGFAVPEGDSTERRHALQVAGNILRMHEGSDAIARLALDYIREQEGRSEHPESLRFVIDSLKNRAETDFLHEQLGDRFTAVSVYSSVQSREKRSCVENSYSGNLWLMKRDDRRDRDEFGSDVEWGQQVLQCDVAADISIDNDENVETKEAWDYKLANAVSQYVLNEHPEIDANTLFMWRAELEAANSRCGKRKVGACLAKEEEIISVGWNRAPDGVDGCLEHKDYRTCYRDHLRSQKERDDAGREIDWGDLELDEYERALINEIDDDAEKRRYISRVVLDAIDGYYYDFKTLEACRALHAEEAAILAALERGADIREATLYTTTYPCMACAKKIAQQGIKEVYFIEPYPIEGARKLLDEKGVRQYRYQGLRLRFAPRILDDMSESTRGRLGRMSGKDLEPGEVYDSAFQMFALQKTVNAILGRCGEADLL